MIQSIIDIALETFRKNFPMIKVTVEDTMLRYDFGKDEALAKRMEAVALATITNHSLPLIAEVAVWDRRRTGAILGVQLIVEMAPEEELIESR